MAEHEPELAHYKVPFMYKLHLVIPIVAGLASSACFAADIDLSKLPPASDKAGLTYAKDIKPMLDASCARCHGGEKPKGGLRLDSLQGVLEGGKDGKVIVTGDSKKSQMVIAAARIDPETAMPPMRPPGGRGGRGPGGPPGGPGAGGPPPGGPGAGGPPPGNNPQGGPGGASGGPGHGGGPGGPGGFGPPPKPLSPEQVGVLRAWIDQGAK